MRNKLVPAMKKGILRTIFIGALSALTLYGCNNAQPKSTVADTSQSDTASIFFEEYEHDFGKVASGEKVACVFTFENRGTKPLVIQSTSTSCGCTVSKYEESPVKPGGKGTIEVTFDTSGRSGKQSKAVTVRSNATKPVVLLKITTDVIIDSNNQINN